MGAVDVQVLVLSRLQWKRLHISGVIQGDVYSERANRSRTEYNKVDAARMKVMMKHGEKLDEGVVSAI